MGTKEFLKIISPDGENRLRVKIVVEKGKVVDIVVQYEARLDNKWHGIVRYDCSHGFFHLKISPNPSLLKRGTLAFPLWKRGIKGDFHPSL